MADVVAELDEGGFLRTVKDLFAGAAGGIAQVLLGMCCEFFVFRTMSDSDHVAAEAGSSREIALELQCCSSDVCVEALQCCNSNFGLPISGTLEVQCPTSDFEDSSRGRDRVMPFSDNFEFLVTFQSA